MRRLSTGQVGLVMVVAGLLVAFASQSPNFRFGLDESQVQIGGVVLAALGCVLAIIGLVRGRR